MTADPLASWQRTRSPRLADALDALGVDAAWQVGNVNGRRPGLRIERERGGPWRVTGAIRGRARSNASILHAFVAGLSPVQRAALTIAPGIADRDAYAAAIAGRT